MKEVATAIIVRNGALLAGQRRPSALYPLKWEFPGGKVEPGESPRDAVARELAEELGISATPGRIYHRQEWTYGEASYGVSYFLIEPFDGEPANLSFHRIAWVTPQELSAMDVLEGNRDVIARLRTQDDRSKRTAILAWYKRTGRLLPWRGITNPYRILLSEVMLQQTRVSRVLEKYPLFLKRFPSLRALARARRADVVRAWQEMGYNNRAVRLHELALRIIRDHRGRIPRTEEELTALPGIGTYTARAVLSSAFGVPVAIVDVNVRRVLSRLFWRMPAWNTVADARMVDELAQRIIPRRRAYDWNQALMDLGATLCTARAPRCAACPLTALCPSRTTMSGAAPTEPKREPSRRGIPDRIHRGRIVERLRTAANGRGLKVRSLGPMVLDGFTARDHTWLIRLLRALERDGLVRIRGTDGNAIVTLA